MRTLPIATSFSCVEVHRGSAMAVVAMIMTLAIILTMIFRKYVIRGLTTGVGKGSAVRLSLLP